MQNFTCIIKQERTFKKENLGDAVGYRLQATWLQILLPLWGWEHEM